MTQQQGDRFLGRTRAQPAQDGMANPPVGLVIIWPPWTSIAEAPPVAALHRRETGLSEQSSYSVAVRFGLLSS